MSSSSAHDSPYTFEDLDATVTEGSVPHYGGLFIREAKRIILGSSDEYTLVHETGHAVYDMIPEESTVRQVFNRTYEEELAVYKAGGGKVPGIGMQVHEVVPVYCTHSVFEMFAECYVLMIKGGSRSDKIINTHFPGCLKQATVVLKYAREI